MIIYDAVKMSIVTNLTFFCWKFGVRVDGLSLNGFGRANGCTAPHLSKWRNINCPLSPHSRIDVSFPRPQESAFCPLYLPFIRIKRSKRFCNWINCCIWTGLVSVGPFPFEVERYGVVFSVTRYRYGVSRPSIIVLTCFHCERWMVFFCMFTNLIGYFGRQRRRQHYGGNEARGGIY